jgi:hypothetical protein
MTCDSPPDITMMPHKGTATGFTKPAKQAQRKLSGYYSYFVLLVYLVGFVLQEMPFMPG